MLAPEISETLISGIRSLGEDPDQHPINHYLQYISQLKKWSKAYNLTSITEDVSIVTHHLLDSLSLLPFIHGDRCLDVGTGAGLPGLVLALARPDLHWVLLDSRIKKIRFLNHILLELKPENVEIVHQRVEDYRPDQSFTSIVMRAVTSLADFQALTAHLKDSDCYLLAMKGSLPDRELAEIKAMQTSVNRVIVPGLDAERHVVAMH